MFDSLHNAKTLPCAEDRKAINFWVNTVVPKKYCKVRIEGLFLKVKYVRNRKQKLI